jgi:hypothetical protein
MAMAGWRSENGAKTGESSASSRERLKSCYRSEKLK